MEGKDRQLRARRGKQKGTKLKWQCCVSSQEGGETLDYKEIKVTVRELKGAVWAKKKK